MKSIYITLALFIMTAAQIVSAKDQQGQFVVDGIGRLSCKAFVEAKDNKDTAYLQFGGWIEGYFSASNKFINKTYDLTPWQTTETLATILYTECSKNPKVGFGAAVDKLSNQLQDFALTSQSPLITVKQGKYSTRIPKAVLIQAQNKLKELGFLSSGPNGKYDRATAKALLAFQNSNKLPRTALPDQYTLWNLLLPK